MSQKKQPGSKRLLYLDVGRIAFPLLLLLISGSPIPRGLFFLADYLPFAMGAAGILLLVALDDVIAQRNLPWGPETLACFGVAVAYAISFTVAVDKHEALITFIKYLSYFALFYSCRRLVRSYSRLKWLIGAILCSAFLVEIIGLGSALGKVPFPGAFVQGVIGSTLQYKNAFGGFLLAIITLSLTYSAITENTITGLALSVLNFTTALTIITTYSRGTWIMVPLALLAVLIIVGQQWRPKALYTALVSMSAAFLVLKKFLEATGAKQPTVGFAWLMLGAGVAFSAELIWIAGRKWLASHGDLDPKYKSLAITLVVLYTLVLGAVYTVYALDAYPEIVGRIFPTRVVEAAGSIKSDETSWIGRMDAIRDAVKITARSPVIGSGGGAWNSLYHMYQEYLYWTTETHSHYFQMLTEVGLLGVLMLGLMWFYSVRKLFLAVDEDNDPRMWVAILGTAMSVLIISTHAAADFDLSLPSNQFLVFSLLGALCGAAESLHPDEGEWGDEGLRKHAGRGDARVSHLLQKVGRYSRLPALLVIVFVLSYYPYNIYKAGHLGAQAARWMWQNNYAEAQKYYKQAVVLDKTDGSYWMDMAQTEVGTYLITRENRRLKLADEYMEKALALQPYAIPLRMKALDLQLLLERGAEGVAAAQELVRLLPLEPRSHEGLARAAMLAAVGALDAKDDKLAATYVGKLLTIEKQYDMLMSRIPLDRPVGHRQNLTVTTRLCIGEGYALDGQYAKAIQYLSDARKDQVTASEAAIWLGLVYVKTGRVQEGNQLLTQLVAAKADLGPIVNRVALLLRLQMSEVPR